MEMPECRAYSVKLDGGWPGDGPYILSWPSGSGDMPDLELLPRGGVLGLVLDTEPAVEEYWFDDGRFPTLSPGI